MMDVRRPLPGGYEVDTDTSRLDLSLVHAWLSTDAFWALGRSYDAVEKAADASVNFGVYDADGGQAGYARVVTDGVTFGWLCDVYIAPAARGQGLGTSLAQVIVDAVRPLGLKRLMLSTVDAHEVYSKVGFEPFPNPQKLMVLEREDNAGVVETE